MEAAQFLHNLIVAVPYKIHTILTDNGIQFTHRKTDRYAFLHIFDRVCLENDTEHRLTQPNPPGPMVRSNERMNRTLKEATVKRYHYENHQQLRENLYNFLNAYHFARRLKILRGFTSYEYIIKCWQNEPEHS